MLTVTAMFSMFLVYLKYNYSIFVFILNDFMISTTCDFIFGKHGSLLIQSKYIN